MPKVMVVIEWPGGPPTIEAVCERYGLSRADFDPSFGVVAVDPDRDLYTVLVDAAAAERVEPERARGWGGPAANPPIEPFGGGD